MQSILTYLSKIDHFILEIIKKYLSEIKKLLQIASYFVLPIFLLIGSLIFQTETDYFSSLGEASLTLLGFILFLTPIVDITQSKSLKLIRTFRREFGVASFWLFFFHAAGLIYLLNITTIKDFLDMQDYIFWGALSGIGMILLALTSNDYSVRLLKRNWKRLQMIAIPAYFFALVHAAMAEREPILEAILLFITYCVLRMIGKYTIHMKQKSISMRTKNTN